MLHILASNRHRSLAAIRREKNAIKPVERVLRNWREATYSHRTQMILDAEKQLETVREEYRPAARHLINRCVDELFNSNTETKKFRDSE
jgi:hypothetical protein